MLQHIGSHALAFTDPLMRNAQQLGTTKQPEVFDSDAWELADRADSTLDAFSNASDPFYATVAQQMRAFLDEDAGRGAGELRAAVQAIANDDDDGPRRFMALAAKLVLAAAEGRPALMRVRAAMRAVAKAEAVHAAAEAAERRQLAAKRRRLAAARSSSESDDDDA